MQKAREILDELRRRAGERYRPQIELDYHRPAAEAVLSGRAAARPDIAPGVVVRSR